MRTANIEAIRGRAFSAYAKAQTTRRVALMSAVCVALGACAGFPKLGGSPATITSTIASYAMTAAQGLLTGLQALGTVAAALSPNWASVLAQVGVWVGKINGLAAQIIGGMQQAAAQPLVQQIVKIFSLITNSVAGIPGLPTTWLTVVVDVAKVLLYIEGALGMSTSATMARLVPVGAAGATDIGAVVNELTQLNGASGVLAQ